MIYKLTRFALEKHALDNTLIESYKRYKTNQQSQPPIEALYFGKVDKLPQVGDIITINRTTIFGNALGSIFQSATIVAVEGEYFCTKSYLYRIENVESTGYIEGGREEEAGRC